MTDFKIGSDDEDPNAIYRSEMKSLKIEKLSQRVTLLTILIPCLVGIMVFFGYLDIKDRLTKTSYTGTQGVEKLSRDMESRFSSLSLKQARLEEALAARIKSITALEKALTALDKQVKNFAWRDKTAIKKVTATINTLAAKKDLKALNATVTEIDKSVAPLSLEISSANVKIEALDTRTSNELTNLTQKSRAINKSLAQLKAETQALETEMRALIADKVDTVALANQVNEVTEPLTDKVNDLLRRVGLLQAEVSASTKAPSPKPAPLKKATITKKPALKPTLKKAIPKTKPAPGKKIVEQELEE